MLLLTIQLIAFNRWTPELRSPIDKLAIVIR